MSAMQSYTEEEALTDDGAYIPSPLDDAIQAGNAAVQLSMFALDMTGENKAKIMEEAKKLHLRAAAWLTRAMEGVS